MAPAAIAMHSESAPPAERLCAVATVRVNVRWADEDGNGHVNNAIYLNYLEDARDSLLEQILGAAAYEFVIAHISIDYLAEITHRHLAVDVSSWLVRSVPRASGPPT